jgi:AmmeMemoRadiSam system protein B/AmmeMemoRadiSam system protein A
MRLVFIVLISILSAMETYSQNKPADRQPYAAGRFYPADKETLDSDLTDLFLKCRKVQTEIGKVRAIISPHAGYVFSGETAASAFSSITEDTQYKNIFVIGSSHVMSFDGASVFFPGDYITPLGRVTVNKEIALKLRENKVFDFPATAHTQEHSLEVQMPFIQHHFKKVPPVIPIIIGTNDLKTIRLIAEALRPWFTPDNLFVISSDFSHYPPYKNAIETDRKTAMSILSGDPEKFLNTLKENSSEKIKGLATSMCGWTSGLTLLYLAGVDKNLQFNLVDYTNSGDSHFGGKDEVVGYNAIALTEKNKSMHSNEHAAELTFTEKEKEQLFRIARNSVYSRFEDERKVDDDDIYPKLMKPMGAFVTIRINGSLRGCIGRFTSSEPLYKVVKASAISSAFEDPRFPTLKKDEYPNTKFEITVLGPMKKINDINEIVLGRYGIYIKKGMNSGTMLPQVATENHWTVEQFLGYTSRDKAGIGWDGWKNAEVFIYEGTVLEEEE